MSSRLPEKDDTCIKLFEIFYPEFWPDDMPLPWTFGEDTAVKLCDRFGVNRSRIVSDFRAFRSNPRKIPNSIQILIYSTINTISVSSSEAERSFFRMKTTMVSLRNQLTIANVSHLMFVSLNGLPCHLWQP